MSVVGLRADPPVAVAGLADRALADHVEDGLPDHAGVGELPVGLVGVGADDLAERLLATWEFEFAVAEPVDQLFDGCRILVVTEVLGEIAELDAEFPAVGVFLGVDLVIVSVVVGVAYTQ